MQLVFTSSSRSFHFHQVATAAALDRPCRQVFIRLALRCRSLSATGASLSSSSSSSSSLFTFTRTWYFFVSILEFLRLSLVHFFTCSFRHFTVHLGAWSSAPRSLLFALGGGGWWLSTRADGSISTFILSFSSLSGSLVRGSRPSSAARPRPLNLVFVTHLLLRHSSLVVLRSTAVISFVVVCSCTSIEYMASSCRSLVRPRLFTSLQLPPLSALFSFVCLSAVDG